MSNLNSGTVAAGVILGELNSSNNGIYMYLDWQELSHTKSGNNWATEVFWKVYITSDKYGEITSTDEKEWRIEAIHPTDSGVNPTITPNEGTNRVDISPNSTITLASGSITYTRTSSEAGTDYMTTLVFKQYFGITYDGRDYRWVTKDFNFYLSPVLDEALIVTCDDFTDIGELSLTYSTGTGVTKLEMCIAGSKGPYYFNTPPTDTWCSWINIPLSSNGSFSAVVSETFKQYLHSGPLSTATSKTCYYYLKSTFADGSVVYDAKAARVTLSFSDINLVSDVYDINPKTIAVTGDKYTFVKYMSNAEYILEAKSVPDGASLVSCYVQNANYKGEPPKGVMNNIENGSFYFYAKDSRGIVKTNTIERTVYDYIKPTCNGEASTELSGELGTGATVKLKISGNFFNGSFGSNKNQLSLYVKHTQNDGTMGEWVDLSSLGCEYNGNTYSLTTTITGLTYEIPYEFHCKCADKLMEIECEPFTIRVLPIFDWSNDDFNFNTKVNMYKNTVLCYNRETNNVVISGGNEGKIYLRPTGTDVTNNEVIIHENGNVEVSGNLDASGISVNGIPLSEPANYLMSTGTEAMGNNGTWYWEKWSNGKAVCWGTRNFGATSVNTSSGGAYKSSNLQQSFPSGLFKYAPDCIQMNLVLTSGSYCPWIAIQGTANHTASETAQFAFCNNTNVQLASTHVSFYIIGRWK